MEGFKTLPKGVKCYKEGGSVYKSRHSEKNEKNEDVAQDKKIIKKAFNMHDKQEHKGEHTDLSKLKRGGRAKKTVGTVNKFKAGGAVQNVYTSKKTSTDNKNIASTKAITPAKAKDQSAAVAPIDQLKNSPMALKKGGNVKKYSGEDGSYVTKGIEAVKSFGRDIKNNIMGTPEQNRIAKEDIDKQAAGGSKLAEFFGGKKDNVADTPKKCGGGKMKRGGKVC
jgi:hypothetical protein